MWWEGSVVIVLPDCTVVMTVQTGQSWNVTSPVQRKGPLTACINTGIFPPVIACSLKKSTQWIPLVFCNALFSVCLFSHLFYPDRGCLLSTERVDGGRGEIKFILSQAVPTSPLLSSSTWHLIWIKMCQLMCDSPDDREICHKPKCPHVK